MACHQRSTSLPSIPHSNEAKVEAELHGIRVCISSPSVTIDVICNGLARLGDIYNSIEEIMCLPSNQVDLSLPLQMKMVEEELNRSLVQVDLCNAMQENLAELKMSTQDLQLVLTSFQLKIESFIRLAKKAQKPFKKASSKETSEGEGCRLVRLLAEAREMAVSLLESTSHLLPKQFASTKASRWSLVSKRFQKRKLVCEEEQLQALEQSIGDLESGAEFLFRRLIQSRISLLNILSRRYFSSPVALAPCDWRPPFKGLVNHTKQFQFVYMTKCTKN